MGIRDALKEIEPNKQSPVEYAIVQLEVNHGKEEVDAWFQALDSGLYKYATLAELLTQYSGVIISERQLADWNRRTRK